MQYFKSTLLTLFFIVIFLTGFILFKFNTSYQLQQSYEAFLKRDYKKAQGYLDHIHSKKAISTVNLYKSYLLREQNEITKSDAILKSLKTSDTHLEEIVLNQLLNASITKNSSRIGQVLQKHEQLHYTLFSFFESLKNYFEGDFVKSVELDFNSIQYKWLKHALMHEFSNYKLNLINAHINIENNNLLLARDALEALENCQNEEVKNEALYLLGISYLKEAKEKSLDIALPYFDIALSYLNQMPIKKDSMQDKRDLLKIYIYKHIVQATYLNRFEELDCLLSTSLGLGIDLSFVSDELLDKFQNLIDNEDCHNIKKMVKIIQKESFSLDFKGKINSCLETSLQNRLYSVDFFKAIDTLNYDHAKLVDQLLSQVDLENDFEESIQILYCLDVLERAPINRLEIANQLLEKAFSLSNHEQAVLWLKTIAQLPFLEQKKSWDLYLIQKIKKHEDKKLQELICSEFFINKNDLKN